MQDCELLNMDCLDYLKTVSNKSIDLVLIDPPYEVSRNTNFQNGKEIGRDTDRFRISMDFGEWDKEFDCLQAVIKECYRLLKTGGTLICFYDLWKITVLSDYFKEAKFKQLRFIEWIKTNPVPINSKINYLTNAREIAIMGIKESLLSTRNMITEYMRKTENFINSRFVMTREDFTPLKSLKI